MTQSIHDQISQSLRERENELIDIHRAIVRVPTVNRGDGTSAEETKCADVMAKYLKEAAGIDSQFAEALPGRANLLASIGDEVKGEKSSTSRSKSKNGGSGPTMLWMSHSDVVPPGDETAWTHPPFSAALESGRIWGRGSNDCKMLVAAQLFVLAELKRLGLPKRGELRLAVGADEETGGEFGFGWLAKNHADFLKTDLAICEGGGGTLGRFEKNVPVVSVGSGEKGRFDVIFRARAEGGHASTPWGKRNPLTILAELVNRINAWQPEVKPASPVFNELGRWVGMPEEITEKNIEEAIARIEATLPKLASSLRGQSRMTLTPTVLHCGDKANAIPTLATLVCDSRLLPGQTGADLEKVVSEILQGFDGVEVEIKMATDASLSEYDERLNGMFQRATERALGAPVRTTPVWCVGATDAHFVRALGTPVYGYQLVHPDADPNRLGIHCIDESIEVRMLLPCALSLAHFALEFFGEA